MFRCWEVWDCMDIGWLAGIQAGVVCGDQSSFPASSYT